MGPASAEKSMWQCQMLHARSDAPRMSSGLTEYWRDFFVSKYTPTRDGAVSTAGCGDARCDPGWIRPPLDGGCRSAIRAATSPSRSVMRRRRMCACVGLILRLVMPWSGTRRLRWARRTCSSGPVSCWRLFRAGPANGRAGGCRRCLNASL